MHPVSACAGGGSYGEIAPPPGRATAWAGLLSVAGVQEQRGPFAHV